jgi:chromate transporter
VGAAALGLYVLGVNELALLGMGALAVLLVRRGPSLRQVALSVSPAALLPFLQVAASIPFDLSLLFWTFLKIGSVLYGSGYVLLAFLRADFVVRLGWLSDKQLLEAIAVGQVTPGPVFTTATFVGYILGGLPGALLATLGIFLPAFIFVALSIPLLARVRASPWASALLDGVNVASLALMAAVTAQLAQSALIDPLAWGLALAAAVLLFRFKLNATWLVLGGAVIGLAAGMWR